MTPPEIKQTLEGLLFITSRPLTINKMSELTGFSESQIESAMATLMEEYQGSSRGIQLNRLGRSYQMTTHSALSATIQKFLEEEEKKELTKPSLETLTIIAYRGPITKAELELIRGVNCSLILRNLLIRGLVEEVADPQGLTTRYQVTFDFLHFLGIREPKELPDYHSLNANEHLAELLKSSSTPEAVLTEKKEEEIQTGGNLTEESTRS